MNSLILDCSCGMNVYVVLDERQFVFEDKTQNKHSDEVLKVVDSLLREAKLNVKDLDNICVCVGPGSFTGVRVAVSVAKGLVIGSNAKVFVLSNFDVFDVKEKNYCLVLDGFSNFVYARIVENGNVKDVCIEVDKLAYELKTLNLITYVSTEKTQTLLNKFEISSNIIQNNTISAFYSKINNGEYVELNQIYPVYLRASQAEIEREKKK